MNLKSKMLIFVFFGLLVSVGKSFGEDFLTKPQKTYLLEKVQDECEMNWCLDEKMFLFEQIKCSKQTSACKLYFTYYNQNDENHEEHDYCKFYNKKNYFDFVDNRGSLLDDFYSELDECLVFIN
jgi:hypothetical protein